MDIGLCGLPRSGKTTLWKILTGQEVPPGARPETRRGVTRVPDPRLDRLAALFKPRKTTPATVTYVDLAPMEKGSGRADNPILGELRKSEALLVVLRAWDDPADPHPEGSIDPSRDLDSLETEFLLADMDVAQRRLERLEGIIAKANREEDRREKELLSRVLAILEEERPLRETAFSPEELKTLRGYAFLSARPLLVAVNLPEDRTSELGAGPEAFGLERLAGRPGCDFVALSARIEEEIAALDEEDARAFREDLGITEPALDRLIRASYRLLGLISFFTVGEDECRAWTIRQGTLARSAAGAIHTDLEKGFIRAETLNWEELLEAGSLAAARERGVLRLEGKDYQVQDGDVMHIRHSS
ncbi:MAG: redox-regulated ATPase YchF [Acidobacteriota bacterium]|nr:redox-regulated ATPase YchF [Acidobacteriota bacterium]MDQ7087233.1 redox-regulated ATPase YchF [Acidobacteriota bacterium]